GQWMKGKSCDTFCPTGPWLVTTDEIKDPQNLKMWLKVNGETKQNSSTKQMIFGVKKLVSYISQFITLMPGDLIPTGTPPGVGLGHKPTPVFLKAGDVMELGMDGLGTQRQQVVGS
ncbi:MAG: fumarylacetoacetate hydrolase family protein, partial [Alphaproteobacteria bacterium]|nr:fumarylacetoacetate hydrolase family protein [Alphaproteobacteria bacterium]